MAGINYAVGDKWDTGFIGSVTVPSGSDGLHGWTLEFDASFAIANIWGARIVSHVGNHYVISGLDWTSNVAPGGQASFGFEATTTGSSGTTATGFLLNGASATGGDPAPAPALPLLSVADASVSEGNTGTALPFTVTLSQASASPVTVHYATSNGTATVGSDYTAVSGTLTFAPGETSKTISVPILGDGVVEANETITLALSSASGATIARSSGTGTIVNDDVAPPPPPPPSSSGISLDYGIASNWGTGFTGTMTLKAGSSALTGWTAEFTSTASITNIWNATIVSHVGDHYVVRNVDWNGSVAAGQSVSFGFQATPGSGGTAASGFIVNGTAIGQPLAPPVLPTLSVLDASVSEGNAGTADLAFTVTLSQAATGPVTVSYGTANGSATAGSDYAAQSGTLTFAPGETSKVVHLAVSGDTAVESNETLTLTLSGATGATIAHATATGTIVNDDVAPPPPPPSPPVLPTVAINDVSGIEGDPGTGGGAGWFSTSGNQIVDAGGHAVQIAGVNWFGFESSTLAPHGLWTRGYKDMMDQMVELGFNTVRLPFSNEMLHSTAAPNGIDFAKNPDLVGLSALQIMDKIVDYAGHAGLRIILDHHRSNSGIGTSGNGLWYDGAHSEAQWIADWQMLAGRYAGNPTVIGADLHNEPFNGTWGGGGPNDWAAAAERAGDAIGTVNPNWLVFVEGVGTYQGQSYWWGGNLMGVRDRPIELDVANKLVYSAHDYPNSVYAQPWFQGADFAANLPAKFDQMWGYIFKQGIAPVFLGEFGTNLTDPKDAPWLEAITSYLGGDFNNDGTSDLAAGQKGPGWTYWSWNPNSGDTGGILGNDWQSVNQNKMAYLSPIQFHFSDDAGSGDSGATATFTLTLSQAATETVTVGYHTVPGDQGTSGASSADFVAQTGTVTFAPGERSKTVSIAITPDKIDEADEHFSVVLTDPHGVTLARATGTATIVDDDTTVVVVPPPPPPPATSSGDLHGSLSVNDSWSGGFNASVAVHNDGSATSSWQLAIEMPNQISNIWNAKIISHSGTSYVIGGESWNTGLAHGADTNFGFTASGQLDIAAIHIVGAAPPPVDTSPSTPVVPTTWDLSDMFSPYIDMAMPVDADLASITHASGIKNFTLAFMLASDHGIGWQGAGGIADDTLSNGSTMLQQVQAVQAAGGHITISFGGAAGQEAALTATSVAQLQAEYQSVIDRYHVDTIDFDIEGAAEANQASLVLRDKAIVGLQAANPGLKVSFTLPVLPTGLDASGLNVLKTAQQDGVHIDMVNIMTMDYGSSVDNGGQMGLNAINAIKATEQQLAGIGLAAKIGVTPMIGVNDIASEVFTLADAQSLVNYAKSDANVAMLSMWSVARDNGGSAGAHYASSDSSGVAQNPFEFAGIFHQFDHT